MIDVILSINQISFNVVDTRMVLGLKFRTGTG